MPRVFSSSCGFVMLCSEAQSDCMVKFSRFDISISNASFSYLLFKGKKKKRDTRKVGKLKGNKTECSTDKSKRSQLGVK